VQPVVVKFLYNHIDPSWTGFEVGLGGLFLRLTSQWYNSAEVTFLPVYTPSNEERCNPILFGNNVRAVMAKELGVRATEHTFEDMFLQTAAIKCHLDPKDVVLGMDRVRRVLHLTVDEVKAVMQKFAAIDKDGNGTISYEEYLGALGIPNSPYAREAFATMIGSDANSIDFRSFLCATTRLSTELGTEEKIALAFETCDINRDGKISEDELFVMLHLCSPGATRDHMKQLFKKIDTRKNGYIDQYEFAAYLRENPTWLQVFFTTLQKEKAQPSRTVEEVMSCGRQRSVSAYLNAIESQTPSVSKKTQ
jgi:lysophosphatidylcholine acyltransferase/lyso-PAF acetyltransferase